jgi:hypothetical protein
MKMMDDSDDEGGVKWRGDQESQGEDEDGVRLIVAKGEV